MTDVSSSSPRGRRPGLHRSIYVMGAGIFSMTTSEFMVAGMMPELASSFGVSIGQVGYLISLYAAGMVLGGPILTLALIRLPSRSALLALGLVFAALQAIGASASDYWVLAGARFISGMASAAFFGVSLSTAARVTEPDMLGRATAVVLGGLMVATVLGLPLATWLSGLWGWRVAYWLVVPLVLLATASLWAVGPSSTGRTTSFPEEARQLRNAALWSAYATSSLIIGAVFATFSFLVPFLSERTSIGGDQVPWILALYGVATVIGNILVGRVAVRWTLTVLAIGLVSIFLSTAVLAMFGSELRPTIAAIVLLGLTGVALNPAMAVRVMSVGGTGALVNTVHTSIICLGVVAGSGLGALSIEHGFEIEGPVYVSMALALLGLATVLPSLRRKSRCMESGCAEAAQ